METPRRKRVVCSLRVKALVSGLTAATTLLFGCSGQGAVATGSFGATQGLRSKGLAVNPYLRDIIVPSEHHFYHIELGKDKHGKVHHGVDSANFTWEVVWGKPGKDAEADCPSTWKVIGGGTNDSDVSFIGIGHYNSDKTGWIAPATASASAESEAFASCVAPTTFSDYFEWVEQPGNGGATVGCGSYDLVTGYGSASQGGHVGVEYPVYGQGSGKNVWIVDGGSSGSVTAHASCVRSSEAVIVHNKWGTGSSISACPEGGSLPYIIIGGSMGNGDYPGSPLYNYPTGTGPGNNNEWHAFNANWPSSTTPVLAHALCAPVTSN